MGTALEVATKLIKQFEGCHKRLTNGLIGPYICPAGYPTQGWGILVPSMAVPPISQEMADKILQREIPRYMSQALAASPILATHPERLGVITSFVFNLGIGRYRASTLRKRINSGDWEGAKVELMKWTKGGGRVLPGLVKRRKTEAEYL